MAEVLSRLFHLTGEPVWRTRAEALFAAFGGSTEALAASPSLLAAADTLESGSLVVIAGEPALPAAHEFLQVALAAPDPAVCVLRATDAQLLPSGHPAHSKSAPPGRAVAYVCRGQVCGLPIEEAGALAARLACRARAPA